MSQSELLIKVVSVLEDSNIPYMLTGSIVSSIQGEPRSTHDIDIIISINNSDINSLVNSFTEPDFYLERESIKEAIKNKKMFNLLSLNEGDKVDFWLLTKDDFDISRFKRRVAIEILNRKIYISAPEDTILAKLYWSKLSGGSKKHFIDALRIYEIQTPKLDVKYLTTWSEKLYISDLLQQIIKEAETV